MGLIPPDVQRALDRDGVLRVGTPASFDDQDAHGTLNGLVAARQGWYGRTARLRDENLKWLAYHEDLVKRSGPNPWSDRELPRLRRWFAEHPAEKAKEANNA